MSVREQRAKIAAESVFFNEMSHFSHVPYSIRSDARAARHSDYVRGARSRPV